MPMTATEVQKLYVAYFNRPADYLGQEYWKTQDASSAARAFAASAEYAATYAGMDVGARVNAIYQNLFGHAADLPGLTYWSNQVQSGRLSIADVVVAVSNGAQGTDLAAFNAKVSASTAFTTALDTTAEVTGYSGTAANNAAKAWLAGINSAAQATAAIAGVDATVSSVVAAGSVVAGTSFALTKGVDAFVGGSGNDTVSGTLAPSANDPTFNNFDSIAGGAGTDTLNIASTTASNFTLPASFTASGFEVVNISHAASGGTGTGALSITNKSINTGITNFSYVDASATADMTAATVAITLDSASSISAKAVGTGTFTTVAFTDKSSTAGERGTTLTTATVEKASGAVTLNGSAISTVNLAKVGGLTTVNADAGTRALTVNATSTTNQGGLTDAEATSATLNVATQAFGTLTVAKAASVTVNTTGTTAGSSVTLAAAKATSLAVSGSATNTITVTNTDPIASLTVSGSGGVTIDVSGMTSLASVDTSASTAKAPASGTVTSANVITIGTGTSFTGGAGQDVVSVGSTTKSVNTGDGDDTVTITATSIASGGSVSGGAGTDILKVSQANAVTIGTGTDAATAAWRAAVTGFETLDAGLSVVYPSFAARADRRVPCVEGRRRLRPLPGRRTANSELVRTRGARSMIDPSSSTSAPIPARRSSRWFPPVSPTPTSSSVRRPCDDRGDASSHPVGVGREQAWCVGALVGPFRPPRVQHLLVGRGSHR